MVGLLIFYRTSSCFYSHMPRPHILQSPTLVSCRCGLCFSPILRAHEVLLDRQRRGAARALEAVAAADVVGLREVGGREVGVSEVGGREDARKEHIKQCVQNFRHTYV